MSVQKRKMTRSRGRFAPVLGVAATLFVLAAAVAQAQPAASQSRNGSGSTPEITRSGRVVIGQWTERMKLEGGGAEVAQITAYYDWTTGQAYREIRDQRGRVVRTLEGRKAPRPFPEEIEEALSKVYDDQALGALIRQQRLTVDGGFLLEQAPGEGPCTVGSRCIQVFLFDGMNVARHTVVDLKSGRVVYRDYVPPRNREIR